jgi:hypothetical protein
MRSCHTTLLIALLFICESRAQTAVRPEVEFESISKIDRWSYGRAYSYDGHHIFVAGGAESNIFSYEYETYYVYSFERNSWDKIKFPTRQVRRKVPRLRPVTMSEFLPGKNKILTMGNPVEIFDIALSQLTVGAVDGAYPLHCGSAVWQNKIYFFGGNWVTDEEIPLPYRIRKADRTTPVRMSSWNVPGRDRELSLVSLRFTNLHAVFDEMTFRELAPLPDKRYVLGKFVGDRLYTLGGNAVAVEFNDIFMYDPYLNQWTTAGFLPHAISQNAIVSDGKLIYVVGYRERRGYLGIYDPMANIYQEYATNLKTQNGALIIHQGKLYYFGGYLAEDVALLDSKLYRLDLASLPPSKAISCSDK